MTRLSLILSVLFLLVLTVFGYVIFKLRTQEMRMVAATTASASFAAQAYARGVVDLSQQFIVRTEDWTTDNHIRIEVEALNSASTSPQRAKELGDYIRTNKMPIDPRIITVDVVRESGTIVASTKPERVGLSEHVLVPIAKAALSKKYGMALAGDVFHDSNTPGDEQFHVAAPIFSPQNQGTPTAALLIHIPEKIMTQKIFFDEVYPGRRVYILNRDGSVIASWGVSSSPLVNQSQSPAFRSCVKNERFSGVYARRDGVRVRAASECVLGFGFTIVVEDEIAD